MAELIPVGFRWRDHLKPVRGRNWVCREEDDFVSWLNQHLMHPEVAPAVRREFFRKADRAVSEVADFFFSGEPVRV